MCGCGCNTCETESTALVLNESKAPKAILSEGLKHHIDNNKPLTEHLYRAGSNAYFNLIAETRSLYSRGILEFTHEDDLGLLTETDLGHFGMYEGKQVPLDFPIELNEQMDIYDDVANMEFGMDYDQLGSNEKEWVRDEIDNMEMRESLNENDQLDILNKIPTETLPWAEVMHPITNPSMNGMGNTPPFMVEGTWVIGFFKDAIQKQEPIIMGTLPGYNKNNVDTTKGFSDP